MPMSWARRTVIRLRDFSMPRRSVDGPATEPSKFFGSHTSPPAINWIGASMITEAGV